MGKLTYIITLAVSFSPLVSWVLIRQYKTIIKNLRFVVVSTLLGVPFFFILEPIAVYWRAWGYNPEKTLGINPAGGTIETLIFTILGCFLTSVAVSALAAREEKGKPFLS